MHGVIGSSYDRAGDTGREARADAPHGRHFERVLKHHHKQQPPQPFPGESGRAGRTANL